MGNLQCRWVRDRLPLLAGDELPGLDRRRVERHLIGCPKCRHHRVALVRALEVLHAASAHSPARPDAPSLWPELARQIRESRRPVRAPLLTWPRRLDLWPAFGLAAGLIVAAVIVFDAHKELGDARIKIAANSRPIAPSSVSTATPVPPTEAPAPSHEAAKTQGEAPGVESVPATRLGYDLDHAMPMGPEAREGKQPTY